MCEPQLERSVLEAKEREELYAIAEALGTKPGSRARKSDLILQILRATGVVVDDAEAVPEKPRRAPRARKAVAAVVPTNGQGDLLANTAGDGDTNDATPHSPTAAQSADDTATDPQPAAGDIEGRGHDASLPVPEATDDDDRRDTSGNGGGYIPIGFEDEGDEPATNNGSANGRGDLSEGGPGSYQSRPQTAQSATVPGAGQGRFDGDAGNRRNRRRRGRERTPDRVVTNGDRDLQAQPPEVAYSGEPVAVKGFLDLRDEGYGFLRTRGYLASPNDVYVSISQVRRFALRKGDEIEGACRPAASTEKYPALLRIDTVSGISPDEGRVRPRFEDLTPLFPDQKLQLETPGDPANLTARIVDLISPIGKGQRGLIVSPPKAGKTTVLKQIAHSIEANHPEVVLMVLLVDERPEEVTDMRRSVKGEVIASTFDRPADEHTQVAELTIERAKRLVELGKDVVIVLDGITRLARAYNLAQPATGRIMSGGIDTGALYPPKKFFGSARNIEEGGSLTILATALVETGSRMDEVIFEEFKGTGNMELRLDRKLAERRIYPALDVNASSTRHEELLFDRQQLQQVWKLRRVLSALGADGSDAAGLQLLMEKIKSTKSNDEFLAEIAKTPAPSI